MEVHPLWKTASIGCLGLFMALLPGAAFAQWVQLGADIDGEAILDESGWSVSFSADGSRVAIGAPNNDGNGTDSGHVRVYQWVDPNWVQLGNDINGNDQNVLCGTSVSLSADGSRVAIGAPRAGRDPLGDLGRVRVYEWFKWTSTWLQVGSDIDGEDEGDGLGYSVSHSADGSRVAIGAPGYEGHGHRPGHVSVFQYVSPGWVPLGSGIYDTAWNGEGFGFSVSLSADGSRVAIGTPFADRNGIDSGHVRVYEWFSWTSTWLLLDSEIRGDGEHDRSGYSVSLSTDGSRLAVGTPGSSAGGPAAGQVRIFEYVSPHWYELGSDIFGEAPFDNSGTSVSFSEDGSYVAIGANINDGDGGYHRGHVRVFEWVNPNWVQFGPDIDGEADADWSGWSVSLSADGSRVAIGAPFNHEIGNRSGHVRVFDNSVVFADGFESGDTIAWSNSVP